jgi:hypothetical protein
MRCGGSSSGSSELWGRRPFKPLVVNHLKSQNVSCITTDGQSASLSCCQAPILGPRPDFCYCQTVAGLLTWGALSDEKTGLSFIIAAGSRQRKSFSGLAVYCENHTEHTNTLCGQNAESSSYLTGNTLHLCYKAQPVNAVWGNNRCLLWEPYETH